MAKHRPILPMKLRVIIRKRMVASGVILAVALVGLYLVLSSRAASPYATVVASSGTTGGVASVITDSGASTGKAVQFGTSRPAGLIQAADSKSDCMYVNSVMAPLTAVEQVTGINYNCIGAFNQGSVDATWADWESPFEFQSYFGYDQWLAAAPTTRTIVLAMDLIPECLSSSETACIATPAPTYDQADISTWESECDAGQFNSYATQLAQNLVSNGWEYTVLRLGPEMNGNWEDDFIGSTTQEQQDWALCFQQETTAMRAVAGAHFLFDWDPNTCTEDYQLSDYYPGNAYVDIIGADAYDTDCAANIPPPPSATTVNDIFTEPLGLNDIQAFATQQGKPMSLPEWGLWPADSAGYGDDPFYINAIGNYVKANNVSFQDYFDDGGGKPAIPELNSSVPNSLAAYISQFK